MIYHAIYFFDTEKEARQGSAIFNSKLVKGTASVLHGDGVDVSFHIHVLVDVVRGASFSKDVFNIPGYAPIGVSTIDNLYSTFGYLLNGLLPFEMNCYGTLDKYFKDYLRASGLNK